MCLLNCMNSIVSFAEFFVVFLQSLLYILAILAYLNIHEYSKYCGEFMGSLPVYAMLRTIVWCPFYFVWFKSCRFTSNPCVNFIGDSIYVYLYLYLFILPANDPVNGLFSDAVQNCISLKHTFVYALCITWYHLCIIDVLLTMSDYMIKFLLSIYTCICNFICPQRNNNVAEYQYVNVRRYRSNDEDRY